LAVVIPILRGLRLVEERDGREALDEQMRKGKIIRLSSDVDR